MGKKSLSIEVERQIANLDRMSLTEIRAMLAKCMSDIVEGHVTPDEGNTLNRAARLRIQEIKKSMSH